MTILFLFILNLVEIKRVHIWLLRFKETDADSKANHLLSGEVGPDNHLPPVKELKSVLILAITEVSPQNLMFYITFFMMEVFELLVEFLQLFVAYLVHNLFFDIFQQDLEADFFVVQIPVEFPLNACDTNVILHDLNLQFEVFRIFEQEPMELFLCAFLHGFECCANRELKPRLKMPLIPDFIDLASLVVRADSIKKILLPGHLD